MKSHPSEKPQQPAFLQAIDATLRTIERRTQLYRNLIITVSIVSLGSLISAGIMRNTMLLFGLFLNLLLCGWYLMRDSRQVRYWQQRILQLCQRDDFEIATWGKRLLGFRHVPPQSLKAMLATLPQGFRDPRLSVDEKQALALNLNRAGRRQEWKTGASTLFLFITLVSLTLGIVYAALPFLLTATLTALLWAGLR